MTNADDKSRKNNERKRRSPMKPPQDKQEKRDEVSKRLKTVEAKIDDVPNEEELEEEENEKKQAENFAKAEGDDTETAVGDGYGEDPEKVEPMEEEEEEEQKKGDDWWQSSEDESEDNEDDDKVGFFGFLLIRIFNLFYSISVDGREN